MTPEERKKQMARLRVKSLGVIARYRALADEYGKLIKTCPHDVQCNGTNLHSDCDEWGHGTAQCVICNKQFGWYCPDSPDHVCHYYSEMTQSGERMVRLIHGNMRDVPATASPDESDDWCLFCGEPDERK